MDRSICAVPRGAVTKALEDARTAKTVNKSQEAALTIAAPEAAFEVLSSADATDLEELFIVASVAVERAEGEDIVVTVEKTSADKCPRCWNYRELGGNAAHPDVCARCGEVLESMGE